MKKYAILLTTIVILFLIFKNFKKENINEEIPLNINKNHICACDSMIIIDYKGPKAQIIWKDKTRSYYCEVREIFYEINDKIKKKMIKKIFVQDFSNLDWGSYTDKWIEAQEAYYVIDSNKDGAMGVTYVPFSKLEDAKKFKKENKGQILKYDQITETILAKSNELLKKRMIF